MESFAQAVKAASRRVREQYGIEKETPREDRSLLVHRLAVKTVEVFEAAALASDGLLRYRRGKWGAYTNDSYALDFSRPDGVRYTFEIVIISIERAKWQLVEGINPPGGQLRWVRLDEMRDATAFLEAKVLELLDFYARGAETMDGIRV